MKVLSQAKDYLQSEITKFGSELTSISVSTTYSDDGEYEVSGFFEEEHNTPKKERVKVNPNSRLYMEINDLFKMIRDNVRVEGNAKLASIHIGSTSSRDKLLEDWPFYTNESADHRIFIGITQDIVPPEIRNELESLVVDSLKSLDSSLSESNIKTVEYLFDDISVNKLQTVEGNLLTKYPHRYYSNVDSINNYVETVSDTVEEERQLASQDMYEIYYTLDMVGNRKDDLPPVNVRDEAEEIMSEFICSTLDTDWEYIVEAEGISFGDFEFENQEGMSYWVNIPIVDGNIGTSR